MTFSVMAQINDINQIHKKFDYFDTQLPSNKIFLSTDKHLYLGSDTVFYQAFLINSKTNLLEKRNVIGHVALLSKDDKIIEQAVIKVTNGIGSGYFIPKRTIQTDEYVIVAYTEAMKNFSSDFYFNKKILLFNGCVANDPNKNGINVEFFAEGGNFVEGVNNKISVQVTNDAGYPILLNGLIKNNTNASTIPIVFDQNGIGTFLFNHIPGTEYFVEFSYKDELIKVNLPKFLNKGVAVTMTSKLGYTEVITRLSENFRKQNDSIHFLFHQGPKLLFSESTKIGKLPGFVHKFPLDVMSTGLSNLTILDSDLNLVSERLFFIKKGKIGFETDLVLTSEKFGMKSKIEASIDLKKIAGGSKRANYSINVFDQKLVNIYPDIEPNIVTYMYLNSELNDRIYNANYYFTESGNKHMNNMLIGKKGGIINWNQLLSDNPIYKHVNFNKSGLTIKVKALYADSNEPAPDSTLISFYMSDYEALFEAYSKKNGEIDARLFFDFDGLRTTFYHAIGKEGKSIKSPIKVTTLKENPKISKSRFFGREGKFKKSIKVQKPIKGSRKSTFYCSDYLLSYQKRNILNRDINRSYFYYLTKDDSLKGEKRDQTSFFSGLKFQSDLKKDLDEYISFRDMRQVTKEILSNVLIRKRKGKDRVRVYNRDIMHTFDGNPLYVIDGIPTYDSNEYLDLNPENVQTVEVVSSFANITKFGNLGKNGIIVVKSKSISGQKDENDKILKLKGFQKKIQKSYPEYSEGKEYLIPDFRSTIYWAPSNQINESGLGDIKYFHSDDISNFLITIQGIILETGEPFYEQVTYNVSPSQ